MKKALSIIGVFSGIIVLLLGVFILLGIFGGKTYDYSSPTYSYDSGYASFGADFYTYTVNNIEKAASACRAAANNASEAVDLIKVSSGLLLAALGLFSACFFGMKFAEYHDADKALRSAAAPAFLPSVETAPSPDTYEHIE